jgi:hypothetical protein
MTLPAVDPASLLALLKRYEDACNSYAVDPAVAMFAPNGYLEINGTQYSGEALRAAHEFDRGSQTQVRFADCMVDANTIDCKFITCDVLDRALGLDGRHMRAEFTFHHGLIHRFLNIPADEEERQRHRQAKQAFFTWAKAHYPDEVAKGATMDYEAGASLTRVVAAWIEVQSVFSSIPN